MNAQAPYPSREEIANFFQTTTMVIENTPSMVYNAFIKKAVKDNWNVTPYEFITMEKLREKHEKEKFSFLLLARTNFENDKNSIDYYYLNLLMGGNEEEITRMPEIASIPLTYASDNKGAYVSYLPLFIDFIQQHAINVEEKMGKTSLQDLDYYNKNRKLLKHKTLLLTTDYLPGGMDTIELKKYYPSNIHFVTLEEVKSAIKQRRENTVVLHHVGPPADEPAGRAYNLLIGTDDARIYYYNSHKISEKNPDTMLKNDFRRIKWKIKLSNLF